MDPILERYQALEDKVSAYTPGLDTQRLYRAFTYADAEHKGQLRKDGTPYITHPLAVAEIVADLGQDADSVIAALLHDTIEDTNATHEEVVEAARKACCDDFISALPDGYNTLIGEGGASLSGGEKQRLSIARAMLKNAPIVIFDEATANVDPENEDRLQTAIEELTKDKTIIMIAHRLKTVRNADQILVVSGGHIVQQGKHDDLIKQKGIYADFINGRKQAIGWKLGANN